MGLDLEGRAWWVKQERHKGRGGGGREGDRENGSSQIEIRIEHWEKEATAPYSLIPEKD